MNGEELQFLPVSVQGGRPLSIAYRFQKPKANKPIFVWFCGFKSEMESVKATALADWARENGAGCLRFDYSGHGKSAGRFEDGTISDWLGQAHAICQHALQGNAAVFVGSSMGGWIATLLARQYSEVPALPVLLPGERRDAENLNGIVLIAPAWDMTRLFWERASEEARAAIMSDGVYYRPSAYGDGPYAITRALIEDGAHHLLDPGPVPLSVPVRILHGCQDPDIPWRHSLRLLEVIGCPDMRLTLVKDGEHRLSRPQDLALLFSTLSEFL